MLSDIARADGVWSVPVPWRDKHVALIKDHALRHGFKIHEVDRTQVLLSRKQEFMGVPENRIYQVNFFATREIIERIIDIDWLFKSPLKAWERDTKDLTPTT